MKQKYWFSQLNWVIRQNNSHKLTLQHLLIVELEIVGTGKSQEVHVLLTVEPRHFFERRRKRSLKCRTSKKDPAYYQYNLFLLSRNNKAIRSMTWRRSDLIWNSHPLKRIMPSRMWVSSSADSGAIIFYYSKNLADVARNENLKINSGVKTLSSEILRNLKASFTQCWRSLPKTRPNLLFSIKPSPFLNEYLMLSANQKGIEPNQIAGHSGGNARAPPTISARPTTSARFVFFGILLYFMGVHKYRELT